MSRIPACLFAVHKPVGITSNNVLTIIKGTLQHHFFPNSRHKVPVGHGGTLDPFATGVLVVGVQDGCKELKNSLLGNKKYEATIALGALTDTFDIDGNVIWQEDKPREHYENVNTHELKEKLASFIGKRSQIPPMYCARHHEGKRLYELAREGIEVSRAAKEIQIYELSGNFVDTAQVEFDDYNVQRNKPAVGNAYFKINRTYVRSIADEVAQVCFKSRGYLSQLRRTEVPPFTLKDCIQLIDCRSIDKLLEKMMANRIIPKDQFKRSTPQRNYKFVQHRRY